ncbi:MAG: 2-amino-4-hydroxy-6-hydroxymethyldihydropteridine diphosphokinase [Gammaproteobacteria bacterium]|nr:2-amino-4-hydroxy-6-hydroxymethyldihydropteridine diphosphokinase [Gammaproteobacteria bacterium]
MNKVPLLTLSLGSNVDAAANIRTAVCALQVQYSGLRCSSVYESESVGFEGENFLNLVAAVETDKPLRSIQSEIKALEDAQGRDRSQARFSSRSIDIDILTFGELCGEHGGMTLPRGEILENAFVLQPMAELLPDMPHPVTGRPLAQHWLEYDRSGQQLWRCEFDWQGALV